MSNFVDFRSKGVCMKDMRIFQALLILVVALYLHLLRLEIEPSSTAKGFV